MNTRLIILVSTLFGMFALLISSIVVTALPLGPDPARPSDAQMTARQAATDNLQAQITAARDNVPPALPPVPSRMAPAAGAPASGPSASASATPVVLRTPRGPAPAARAAVANDPPIETDTDDERHADDDHHDSGDHHEGDDDDD